METRRTRMWMGWAATCLIAVLVLGLVAAPPFTGDGIRQMIMAVFSSVCHQIPGRSPHLNGVQLAVCDRCLGIYTALAAASFLFPILRIWDARMQLNAKYLMLAAVLVPGVDWVGDIAGLWVNTTSSRLLTGAVFGGIAGFFLTGAVVGLVTKRGANDAPETLHRSRAGD